MKGKEIHTVVSRTSVSVVSSASTTDSQVPEALVVPEVLVVPEDLVVPEALEGTTIINQNKPLAA